MELSLIILSTLVFLGSFGHMLLMLRRRTFRRSRGNLAVVATGFLLQSAFLYLRGMQHGGCPIRDPWELLIFVAWAMILLYFIVGPAFHLSLLGVFASGMAFVFQTVAIVLSRGFSGVPEKQSVVDPWLEVHASISLVAYGAFALSCVAGMMFLIQDKHLKKHDVKGLFYHLPPINHLAKAIFRLQVIGVLLLMVGMIAAYGMETKPELFHRYLSYSVWTVYMAIILVHIFRGISSRRFAIMSIGAFSLPVVTLWLVSK